MSPHCLGRLNKGPIFVSSSILVFLIVVFGALFEKDLVSLSGSLKAVLLKYLGFLFALGVVLLMGQLVHIYFRFGEHRIGGPGAKVEFSYLTWFAMLFSAGLGTGLVYSGIFEPMAHFFSAPQLENLSDSEKIVEALHITYFHWGFPAWVLYSATGLGFALLAGKEGSFDVAHYIPKPFKGLITVIMILSILVGVIATLVIAASQVNSGVQFLLPSVPNNSIVQACLIVGVTFIACLSVLSGLKRGIKVLSQINLLLAVVIFIYFLCQSDFSILGSLGLQSLGVHSKNFFKTLAYESFTRDSKWLGDWTFLYWAWWASWAPFVGLFMARISRGRTVREFILGTVVAPSVVSFVWFGVFGLIGYAMNQDGLVDYKTLIDSNISMIIFESLNQTSHPLLFSILTMCCITVFFVTSSDSGSYVVDLIAAEGKEENTSVKTKIYWSSVEGGLAIALLFFGGLSLVKDLTVIFSFPVFIYIVYSFFKLPGIIKSSGSTVP